jgi:hypothetical protein
MCAVWLCLASACAHAALPPPATPLVPTADEAWRSQEPAAAQPTAAPPLLTVQETLENGLTLLLAPVPATGYARLQLVVRHYGDREAAHLLATSHWAAPHSSDFTGAGVHAGALGVSLNLVAEPSGLPSALSFLGATLRAAPTPAAISRAAHAQASQERQDRFSIERLLIAHLRAHLLGVSLPSNEAAGQSSRDANTAIPSTQARLWKPSNSALVIAGDFNIESLRSLARAQLGAIGPAAQSDGVEPAPRAPAAVTGKPGVGSIVFVPTHVPLALISVGFSLPAATERDRNAAEVLTAMLGKGLASLLNESLRERLGLTYVVNTALEIRADSCMLYGVLAVKPSDVHDALSSMRRTFSELRERAKPAAFERARAQLQAERRLAREHVGLAAVALEQAFLANRPASVARAPLPDDISADTVRMQAERYLDRPLFVITGSGDVRAALQGEPAPVAFEL